MGATNGHEPKNGKPFPISLMPLPDGLSIACQRILANLAFAVIVWLTGISYVLLLVFALTWWKFPGFV